MCTCVLCVHVCCVYVCCVEYVCMCVVCICVVYVLCMCVYACPQAGYHKKVVVVRVELAAQSLNCTGVHNLS